MGDKYIRNLLVLGATGTMRYARTKGTALATWITKHGYRYLLRGGAAH